MGQAPWPARDALVPLLLWIQALGTAKRPTDQGVGRTELKRAPCFSLSFLPSRAGKQTVSPGYRIVYCSNLIVVMETAEVLPCFAVARMS